MAASSVVDVYNVFEIDTTKPWQTLSHYFPDKVGGKPSWLSLKPLPSPEMLTCGRCGKPCSFLLQKYAPIESLHRMIFIFLCRDPACCCQNTSDNFVALRSQLPFKNDFYSEAAPDEEYFDMSSVYPAASRYSRLCVVCGCSGPKVCGKCHRMAYCSKEHQTKHWKAGHRTTCGDTSRGALEFQLGNTRCRVVTKNCSGLSGSGTKPNTNPKTNTNPHPKLTLILTLFSRFMLFLSTVRSSNGLRNFHASTFSCQGTFLPGNFRA